MCCSGHVQLASTVVHGEFGERDPSRTVGNPEGLNPKKRPATGSVNSKNAFPVDTQQVGVNRAWPGWIGGRQLQRLVFDPAHRFTLNHDSHGA